MCVYVRLIVVECFGCCTQVVGGARRFCRGLRGTSLSGSGGGIYVCDL